MRALVCVRVCLTDVGKIGKPARSKKVLWEEKWKGIVRGTCVNKYPEPKLVVVGMDVEEDEAVLEAMEKDAGRLSLCGGGKNAR